MRSPPAEFVVAESRYLDSGRSSALDIFTDLDKAVQLNLQYHFSGPLCAAYWIDLCHSRDYHHDQVGRAVERAVPGVVEVLRRHRTDRMNVLSLGPGDGGVDIRLLDAVRSAINIASYSCIDFSFDLLEYAVRHVAASGVVSGVPVKAICADFTALNGFVSPGAGPTLVVLTGYTIGNNNESQFLAAIAHWMRAGDHILLDARLHGFGPDETWRRVSDALLTCYDNSASNRFAFGPVETVTTARPSEVEFDYRVGRFLTVVPGGINVVTGCAGLDARMRLSGARVARDHMDLASTTLYNFDALGKWLAESPLRLVFALRHEGSAIFLLEKPVAAECAGGAWKSTAEAARDSGECLAPHREASPLRQTAS